MSFSHIIKYLNFALLFYLITIHGFYNNDEITYLVLKLSFEIQKLFNRK
jgi:hypothetical protein